MIQPLNRARAFSVAVGLGCATDIAIVVAVVVALVVAHTDRTRNAALNSLSAPVSTATGPGRIARAPGPPAAAILRKCTQHIIKQFAAGQQDLGPVTYPGELARRAAVANTYTTAATFAAWRHKALTDRSTSTCAVRAARLFRHGLPIAGQTWQADMTVALRQYHIWIKEALAWQATGLTDHTLALQTRKVNSALRLALGDCVLLSRATQNSPVLLPRSLR